MIWIIAFLAIAGVIMRPFNISEAIWAVTGAFLLVVLGLITLSVGFSGIIKGTDVYMFLAGMMLLAETAREEKLFDWLAAHAIKLSKGSASRLFLLIYLVGIVVTTFLSNDATAVVLTPAVAAAVKAAKVKKPLPYLLICAFIANAASFVLPISNPANLVIYGRQMPTLLHWISLYIIPSFFAISSTYFLLRITQRNALKHKIETNISMPALSPGGKTAIISIGCTAIILLVSSALNIALGLPTAITGVVTSAVVMFRAKKNPWIVIKGVSWPVIPLVAGLFVIVEALNTTGVIETVTNILHQSAMHSAGKTAWLSGVIIAFGSNLMNNLPAGLIAGNAIQAAHVPEIIKSSVLIGVDLGPNLSVTGSLATILWLLALRREGESISGWTFIKLGSLIMTIALLLALGSLWI
ncbi:MAG: arsenic transporter [Bacteroidota bacterium]|nr:arsenic transporter [Bacteroidota bacterium]